MELPGGRTIDVNDRTFMYLRSLAINCDLDLSVKTKLLYIENRKKEIHVLGISGPLNFTTIHLLMACPWNICIK